MPRDGQLIERLRLLGVVVLSEHEGGRFFGDVVVGALGQGVYARHFVRRELEVKDLEVLAHVLGVERFRKDRVALLDAPAQRYLRRSLPVRCGDLAQNRLGEKRPRP